jgi:hypothetical protein
MNHFIKCFIILGFLGFQVKSPAQTSINSGGGKASGSGGTVSYSIGQVAYSANSSSGGSVIEGVQQPYEISVMTGLDKSDILLTWSVYPNPVSDELTLRTDNYDSGNLSYKLFDTNGNLLENKNITGLETNISMTAKLSGIYFIQVYENNIIKKTFKIIKR